MDKPECQFGFLGKHEWEILGTPRSAMTWRLCGACGLKIERGPGLFYNEAGEVLRLERVEE